MPHVTTNRSQKGSPVQIATYAIHTYPIMSQSSTCVFEGVDPKIHSIASTFHDIPTFHYGYVTTSVPEGGETINDPSRELTDLSGVLYDAFIEVCGE